MSTYLWIDLGAVALPFLFSFHPRLRFHRRWRGLALGVLVMMLLFIPWDIRFTMWGVWGFTPEHILGIQFCHLPLEEWLFFLCIPYACLFTYHAWEVLRLPVLRPGHARAVSIALIIIAFILGLSNLGRAYTATTFIALGIWFSVVVFGLRAPWLGRLLTTYAVLLLPFSVVNGLLTRTDRPVVWYDDAANLGIRIGSIPVEDVFYGLLMMGIVVMVYEAFDARAARTADR